MAKEKKLDAKGYRQFGMRDCLAYASGDFGCNMSFALKSTLIIFWTQFMGMDSIVYGVLLLIVQIWDAINDPLIGTIIDADRRKYRRNKFLAYIWFGSIGLLVAGAMCFLPFPNAPATAKNILFVAGYILWDAFYTIANVPYGSLLSLISDKPEDRASLSAWRSVGSIVGNMVPMVILPMLIYKKSTVEMEIMSGLTGDQRPIYNLQYVEAEMILGQRVFVAALIMGVLGFIAFQFMIRNTEIRCILDVKCNEDAPKFNLIKAMGNFIKNRPAVGATLAAMGMFIGMQGAAAAVTVMFQSYFNNVAISGLVSMFAMIPIVVFTPLARKMVVKYGKKELSTVGALTSIAACIGMCVLPITPDGTGLLIYIICQLVNSLGTGIYSTVSWSMMGDAIDYNEWKYNAREEGTVYALHSFFRKLAQGLGPSFALFIMAYLGYEEKYKGYQIPEVALKMRYLVAVLYLVAAIAQFVGLGLIYNLDKKTLAKMNEELEARHVQ